jgi:Protein of unknown function (DUF1186)/SEC-C motif
MDIPSILDQLAHAEGMPADAILAAREQRAAVAPALIDLIERYLDGDGDAFALEGALFYAFHLLGEWRETAAYRPLARLLALEEDEVEEVLGDARTETVHRVMAAVFDGDPQPLYEVIEAEQADPFVRSRMLETLALLVLRGELARDAVTRYLRDAFSNLRPHEGNFVWYGWQSAIAALNLKELSSLVRKAFARGLIDPGDMSLADFEAHLKYARAHPDSPWDTPDPNEFAPFEDTIAEFASWQLGRPDDLERGPVDDWAFGPAEAVPATNPLRHVGRNDPCPCGSGKKFKRCCLV